jgi:tetratricopeptide (TPR) repeat protein
VSSASQPRPETAADATVTGIVARTDLEIGSVVADRFRIDALLGIGGMGVVYRAWDRQLDIAVAIKLLRPEFARRPDAFARFRDEVLLSRQVSSPHVVRIHDLINDGERWLLSMDWIDGGSLEALLDRKPRLPIARAIALTRQIALGLAAAHARGVIHRDLKPANILLDREGNAYVSDFGVARAAGSTGLTGTGAIVGTPGYLSPEQARGQTLDGRSDLYALGLIVFEVLADRLPFDAGTAAETAVRRLVQPAPPVTRWRPETPAWLARLVSRLLALRPQHRLADAEAVVRAIDEQRVGRGVPGWRRLALAGAVAAALAGATAVALNFDAWVAPPLEQWGVRRAQLEWALLPIVAAPADQAVARALDELLVRQLIEGGIVASGSNRIHRRLRLLGVEPDEASTELARLDAAQPARQWLHGRIAVETDRYRIEFDRLDRRSGDVLAETRSAALTADAIAPAVRAMLGEIGVVVDTTPAWPVSSAALVDFGIALDATGDVAVAALERCLAAEPRFAAAWTERLRIALSPVRAADAGEIAARARAALAGATGPAVERALAWAAWAAGDDADAPVRFERLLARNAADLDSSLALARLLGEQGDAERALTLLDALLARDPYDVDALIAAGRSALDAGEPQRAVDRYFGRALQVATRLDLGPRIGEALNGLGVAYERLGQVAPALDHYTRAATLREAIGDARGAAMSLRNLAHNQAVAGDFDAAAAQLARARALLEPTADASALAALATDEGLLAEERGDYAGAAHAYLDALAANRGSGDSEGIAQAHYHLGFVHVQTGEFASAQVNLLAAADAYRTLGDAVGVLHAEQALALIDLADADLERARGRIDATTADAKRLQLAEEHAVGATLAANLALLEGRYDDAGRSLDTATELFTAREDRRGLDQVALLRIALFEASKPVAVEPLLDDLRAGPTMRPEQAATLSLLAVLQSLRDGDAASAAEQAERTAELALNAGLRPLALRARLTAAEAWATAGRTREAAAALAAGRSVLGDAIPRLLELESDAAALALASPERLATEYARWLDIAGPLAHGALAAVAHRIVARRVDADPALRASAAAAIGADPPSTPRGTPPA